MAKHKLITLPQSVVEVIDQLDVNVSIKKIEKLIIEQAQSFFGTKWGSIKYYYGEKFVNGYTTVPQRYRLKPRKRGFMYKTVKHNKPHILTEKILREVHPEAKERVKSIIVAPLRMDANTIANVSLVDIKDRTLSESDIALLSDFGTIYGRLLKMAHTFAAEKKAIKNRDTFMSFASHELKNPLMAALSYSQLMKGMVSKKKEIKAEWVDKLLHEIDRMKALISELLDTKTSSEGELQYNLKPLSLKVLLEDVRENFQVRNSTRPVELNYKTKGNLSIIGDEVKLTQVFINLLNNADKFSAEEKIIKILVSETKRWFTVAIKDKGFGIPVEEIPYIFNEFYRGTNGEQKKGIGIGLFLTKRIIDSHNGKIKVKSELGKGTTFTIKLPKYSS